MNRIQKAGAAVIALTITLVGATLVTAPLALADMHSFALHQAVSGPYAEHNTSSTQTPSLRHG
jgi:hypothetical protein